VEDEKEKNFRWCRSLALYSAAHFSSLPYLMAKLFFRIKNKKEKSSALDGVIRLIFLKQLFPSPYFRHFI
jgi:uncharacterized protein YqhQ